MSDKAMSWGDLHARIQSSLGVRFINQTHQRSFSLNLFQMNAVALMDAVQRVHDLDHGLAWMSEANRVAGQQAHRELHRHVHNFVASALTLVEHTRIFMRANYDGSTLKRKYEERAEATFANSPTAQFVQGLRNYFLHKGMPNTSMYLRYRKNPGPESTGGSMTTGVQMDTDALLEWENWKAPARQFLEQNKGGLLIGSFVRDYTELVTQFHAWLQEALYDHHAADLEELARLQDDLAAMEAIAPNLPSAPDANPEPIAPLAFGADAANVLDAMANQVLAKVRKLMMQDLTPGFETGRPTVTIHERDVRGPVRQWGRSSEGEVAWVIMQYRGDNYGLLESDHAEVQRLVERVMQCNWARECLSRDYIETCFADWAMRRWNGGEASFHEALSEAARTDVTLHEVWAPIANMEIEEGFTFGPVRIESVTPGVLTNIHAQVFPPEAVADVRGESLLADVRARMQGLAAVVISVHAEPSFALDYARAVAHDAVRLLRFFSPGAINALQFNPVHLLGYAHIPTSYLVAVSEGTLRVDQKLLSREIGFWRLSSDEFAQMQREYLDDVASLLVPDGLSAFAKKVRAALLDYSKAGDAVDIGDRLERCVSAIEDLFLRHDVEPRSNRVASRLAILLGSSSEEHDQVQTTVRQAYWLREKAISQVLLPRDEQLVATFVGYARLAILTAVANLPRFGTPIEFIDAIENRG